MDSLRRAAIWTVAIELPLAVLALLSTIPPLYRTVPLVLTTHLPGIALLDTLDLCCGIHRPSFKPPMLLSVTILAVANAVVVLLCAWMVSAIRVRLVDRHSPARP